MPQLTYHTELRRDWRDAPLAFWVHREVPSGNWRGAVAYEPPAPKPLGRTGYRFLMVNYGTHTLEFSSSAQLTHFVEVLAKKPLPTTRRLSSDRGTSVGPNGHWLSRLPAALKSAKHRAELVYALRRIPGEVFSTTANKSLERRRGR